MRGSLGWSLGLFGLGLAGCQVGDTFSCQSDQQCRSGRGGLCQPNGYCSFDDRDCLSGQRYGSYSGQFSDQCVPSGSTSAPATTSTGGSTHGSTGGDVPPVTEALDSGLPLDSTAGSTTRSPDETAGDEASDDEASDDGGGPLDLDLVLWLEFDHDAMGETIDSSPAMNAVTCALGCPGSGPGRFDAGATFDGIDDVLEVPHGPHLETPAGFTLSLWFRLDAPPSGHHALITKPVGDGIYNSWELYFYTLNDTAQLNFKMYTDRMQYRVYIDEPFPLDQWTHLAATWDGAQIEMWRDGQSVGSRPAPALQMDDHPVLIGADDDNNPALEGFFAGSIDDVRIYQRALGPEELDALRVVP